MKEMKASSVKRKLLLWVVILTEAFLCSFGAPFQASAEENGQSAGNEKTEVVFLLDASVSMNKYDKDHEVTEAIRQMAYSLPSCYEAGFVAYNTEIQVKEPLTSNPEALDAALETVTYSGYTNAGVGLTEAVALFSEDKEVKRYIIMISDGEIDMPGKKEKELSRESYVEAANRAKEKGIQILIGAIGTEIDASMHIFDGAELTDGAIYWEEQAGSAAQMIERMARARLKIPWQAVGITDAGGGSVRAKLPAGAGRVRLILTAEGKLEEITADYSAESGHTTTGTKYVVVDMLRPSSEYADIHFQAEAAVNVKAYLIAEYFVKPEVEVSYRIEAKEQTQQEIKKHIPPEYEHFADIAIKLADTQGEKENLWDNEKFEGQEVSFLINDAPYMGIIREGQIKTVLPADGIEAVTVSVNRDQWPDIYYIEQPVTVEIEKYADPEPAPAPDYRPLWIILGILAAAILLIVFRLMKKRSGTVIYIAASPKESEKKMETKNCTYSGRFSMYVVRTREGRDIPPQSYVLFGRANGRLTLDKILTSCGIKFGKIGAEDIIFYPGQDHSIIMMDQSEGCTVMRGSEIMKKGMGYPVFYNEKITVTFEDEMTEMEIHYKNLKPGERELIKGI